MRIPAPSHRFDRVGFSEIVKVRNRVMALLAAGQKVHRFEGGEPYMTTPGDIKRAMEDALARDQTRYAPSSGIPELRRAILEKVRRRNGIPADDESPIVVNGGMHGLFAAFATLLDPGDEVLMFSPYWTPIVDLIAWSGGAPVLVPTERARDRGISATLSTLVTPRTKVLYWNSPNNPTGDVFSRREVEEVCAFVAESGLAMISDEAYEDLIYEGEGHVSPASFPGMFERTLSVFTLSKSYSMTGWRS
ncbi:MAG TPA: aminotransferase class I/II-fold pyridoxal phosphate-dependent enzyme, partial [Thermoanaerobaculia bacterium]|nr:aminotransferase class I/II-fold pyridoxal phosphate-dependent enzyme [Thermoanaerobaculia bacterium]